MPASFQCSLLFPTMASEATTIVLGLIVIIVLSFLLVICILPLVDKFCSTYVGPTWVPEFIVREGYDASQFLPSLTKEERILVLEKVFQVRVSFVSLYIMNVPRGEYVFVFVRVHMLLSHFNLNLVSNAALLKPY